MNIRAHVYVSGRVQGVFYRTSAKDVADRLGVTGVIRNLRDGRVEIIAEGDRGAVEAFVAWCRKGPPGARVEACSVSEEACTAGYANFAVVR